MFQEAEEREREPGRNRGISSFGPRKDIGPEPIGSGVEKNEDEYEYSFECHWVTHCPDPTQKSSINSSWFPPILYSNSYKEICQFCLHKELDFLDRLIMLEVKLSVALGMLCQVVTPHEPLLTEGVWKLFFTCVGSVVPGVRDAQRPFFGLNQPQSVRRVRLVSGRALRGCWTLRHRGAVPHVVQAASAGVVCPTLARQLRPVVSPLRVGADPQLARVNTDTKFPVRFGFSA
ncbi:hypothetical protein DUI87_01928 [Hirundo rustica rustica]|uniref:Uncharacterized protein n=1 Tax=Hirundo rustica rustica TaxID=333673 RepID=A0A3M0L7K0_HIRRU|nr:hypothetical protein DUI87_01928 [Hirundo rustica rustica]